MPINGHYVRDITFVVHPFPIISILLPCQDALVKPAIYQLNHYAELQRLDAEAAAVVLSANPVTFCDPNELDEIDEDTIGDSEVVIRKIDE
ncbi:unnamed protein product [Protopolystoma xenopodis]|uniref:Uncharacterized protein n=1 Tax=Protopolystoma xenopodis TaxID=117903 RepID=A0A3S5BKX9_9PLAT|nr:unnamed protein product [Protopolystoma xenopodis]